MKTWYCVTSVYHDNDDVAAAVTETLNAHKKPANTVELMEHGQIWVDWFPSLEEAELFVAAALAD